MRRSAGRAVLIVGLAPPMFGVVFGPVAAFGQVEIGKIEVDGPAPSPTGATSNEPVDTLSAAAIARTGSADLGAALARLPEFGSQGVNGANAGGDGAAFVDLRNLNFDRTLVLVDGQRFVVSGIRTDEAVDFNNIPLALVDHVDILADGSQPEWGPDAVAGAVNVVLKHHLDGLHIDAMGGTTSDGGAGTEQLTLSGGRTFTNLSVLGAIGYQNRDPLLQSDRDWSRDPIASAAIGSPPVIGSPATPGGHAVNSDGTLDTLLSGRDASRAYDPATDGYVDTRQQDLIGGTRRLDVDGMLTWTITPTLIADAQAIFTDRRTDQLAPPQALGLNGTGRYPQGFVVPSTATGNPFGQDVLLQRVLTEAGAQRTTTDGPTLRVVAGLRGLAGDIGWHVTFDHGQSTLRYATTNAIDLANVFDGIAHGADYFGPGTLTPGQAAAIRYTDVSNSFYSEDVARATAAVPLVRLAGGMSKATLGGELRFEHGQTSVSPVVAAGDQAGGDAAPTGGGYVSRDLFADVDLPLLKNAPFAHALDGELSGRVSNTDRFGLLLTWKGIASWAPDRVFRLRATAGLARRPPAITEAFGGIAANYVAVADPCDAVSGDRANPGVARNCAQAGLSPGFRQASPLIDVASGGNPDLRAETSQSFTLGLVVSPPALSGLVLSADWYDYRIRNAIDSLADTDPNTIPDGCYASPNLSSPLCALIDRAPSGAGAGQINRILALDENVGTIRTSGIDFDVALHHALGAGRVAFDWRTTWLLDWRIRELGSPGSSQYAGTFPSLVDVGSYTRLRSLVSIDYEQGSWSASWQGRLIGGGVVGDADPRSAFGKTGPVFYQDVSVARRIGKLVVTAGIDNLADVPPPTLVDGVTNTDVNTYDVLGRFVYARLSVVL